jgi:hypothetical protein
MIPSVIFSIRFPPQASNEKTARSGRRRRNGRVGQQRVRPSWRLSEPEQNLNISFKAKEELRRVVMGVF